MNLFSYSFLENIVSVRGSNNSQGNTNGDYSETNEYSVVSKNLLILYFLKNKKYSIASTFFIPLEFDL